MTTVLQTVLLDDAEASLVREDGELAVRCTDGWAEAGPFSDDRSAWQRVVQHVRNAHPEPRP